MNPTAFNLYSEYECVMVVIYSVIALIIIHKLIKIDQSCNLPLRFSKEV